MPVPSDLDPDWTKQQVVKKGDEWTVDGRPTPIIDLSWCEEPSNIPGRTYVGLKVTYPVNAASPPHNHGGAAVAATVLKGRVLNQMVCADGTVIGPQIYEVGESWYEGPGCHHVRCSNAGEEDVVFIASMVADSALIKEKGMVDALVQIDAAQEAAGSKP